MKKIFSILGGRFCGRTAAAFPFTLPFSQGEREHPLGNSVFSKACPANPASSLSKGLETILPLPGGEGRGEGERSLKTNSFSCIRCLSWLLLFLSAATATAQTNQPQANYIRSYINDVPNQPLVTVAITGATNVSCFTIEELLPAPATALSISGDGVYLPAKNVIRWGPYFNTAATNVSYRLTGLPGAYPVGGGSWMDGHWYFSPGVTTVNVLPAAGTGVSFSLPQVATPPITITPPGTVPLFNGSFETPALSAASSVYFNAMTATQLVLLGWIGSGNSASGPALFTNNALGYVTVSNGVQAVSLQSNAVVSQTINFYAPGTYTLNWLAAALPGQTNPAVVRVDGATVFTWQATNTAWQWFTTPLTIATGGQHTISFAGLGNGSLNVSVGLDAVSLTGTNVPASAIIYCPTPGATIYYTLDGTLPTTSSLLYTGAIYFTSPGVVRAAAFETGWLPSVASVAYYGPPAVPANAQVTRSVNTSSPTAPVVTFTVTPGTNARCETLTETLPAGLGASNVTGGGNYIASNNVVLWGPFLGTNVQTLSYTAVGLPGTYPVQATWSVDGVGGTETGTTNIVIAPASGNVISPPLPQVATPGFIPASGGNVPVSVTITDATPGAVIYYTLNGSVPTTSSTLYTSPVNLAAAGVIRAAAFANGWTPSVVSVAYFGPPAVPANAQVVRGVNTGSPTAPVVTFTVTPGMTAKCVAITETLPAGLGASNVSAGGNYIASNNVVLWGPFFGPNVPTLSYTAVGLPGTYPVQAVWSVDGVSGTETPGTSIVIGGGAGGTIPTPPLQVPTPVLTPAAASNLPVTVAISCSDGLAQIYYTTDGSLPTPASAPYTASLTFNSKTSLRAVAFHTGYLPSVAALGEYVPVITTNLVSLARSVAGNGSFLPTISLTAAPMGTVNCYAVVETVPFGLTASSVSGDGVWDPVAGAIRWGPYLDNQSRLFSYNVSGATGLYPLSGQVSVNGYSMGSIGAVSVQVNAQYIGSPPVTNLAACATDNLTYNVNIDPDPGVITVTNATGTVNWGDGTQSAITQPVMTLQKAYTTSGTYPIVVTANWTGYTASMGVSGTATRTDSVQVVTSCLKPQIVNQPSNQVVLAGTAAQFTVNASSATPMTYQWYLNTNTPVSSPSAFATLTLPNVTPSLAGYYSVVITNSFGSVTSSVASLTVVTPVVNHITKNSNGSVTLNFAGLPNATTRIWATTNLAVPAGWLPIYTNTTTAADGTWQFIDLNAAGYSARFYRFSTP